MEIIMPTKLEEAHAALQVLKDKQSALYDQLREMERWRKLEEQAREMESQIYSIQEEHLEKIGMPAGHPTKEFLQALADKVGAAPCDIKDIREKGNASRYSSPVATRIYDKARRAVPEVPAAAEIRAKAKALRAEAEENEKVVRASKEYNDLRRAINDLSWPIRMANEEVDRCRKNEEARDRRQWQKEDAGLKVTKALREKLNAILESDTPFTWEP